MLLQNEHDLYLFMNSLRNSCNLYIFIMRNSLYVSMDVNGNVRQLINRIRRMTSNENNNKKNSRQAASWSNIWGPKHWDLEQESVSVRFRVELSP